MKLLPSQAVKTDLDFHPRKPWPHPLPLISNRGQLLVGFERRESVEQVLDLDEDWLKVIGGLYPQLSAVELLRLSSGLEKLGLSHSLGVLFQLYGLHWTPGWAEIKGDLNSWPLVFQDWCAEKDLGLAEMSWVLRLKGAEGRGPFLEKLAHRKASRSEGVKLLELLAELVMLEEIRLADLDWTLTTAQLTEYLWQKRHPMRAQKVKMAESRSKKLSWPKHSQCRWDFSRDLPALELKLRLQSVADLRKLSEVWPKIEQQVQDGDSNPWG
jgi:hypothetical protein